MSRVLVTGGTGLIGRHTLECLRQGGYEVRAFQRGELDGVDNVRGDVRVDRDALCQASQGCAAVVHLAGRGDVGASRQDPFGAAALHATGALNALEAAHSASAAFVLASSQRIYPLQPAACGEDDPPEPDSPYGYTKWVAELWCRMAARQMGVSARVLRFFSVYGPGQQPNGGSVVAIFAHAALAGEPLVVQSAGRRDFTDARDVARGIVTAIDDAQSNGDYRTYNIATGVGTTFRALAEMLIDLTHSSSTLIERFEEPSGRDLVADVSRARQQLGFEACIPLTAGLEHYVEWLRRQSCS